MAKLFLVGTPIGNLGDFSQRGQQTLQAVDFIAAEDTRVTRKLLAHFNISKPMVSYYRENHVKRGEEIVSRVLAGESCALVTDAGMPAISDPGEDLVRLCAEAGVEVVAVPGPSAFVSALALSGLRTRRFCFEGFLSTSKPGRREHLNSLRFETRTMIFYEAPHKLRGTLSDLLEAFGDRRIAVGRELTKIHEEVLRTTISHAIEHFEAQGARGEFVLIVEGAPSALPTETFLSDAVALARSLMEAGTAPAPAAKEAARITGCKKIDIYRELVQKSDADE